MTHDEYIRVKQELEDSIEKLSLMIDKEGLVSSFWLGWTNDLDLLKYKLQDLNEKYRDDLTFWRWENTWKIPPEWTHSLGNVKYRYHNNTVIWCTEDMAKEIAASTEAYSYKDDVAPRISDSFDPLKAQTRRAEIYKAALKRAIKCLVRENLIVTSEEEEFFNGLVNLATKEVDKETPNE